MQNDMIAELITETAPLMGADGVVESDGGGSWAIAMSDDTAILIDHEPKRGWLVVTGLAGSLEDAREETIIGLLALNRHAARNHGIRVGVQDPDDTVALNSVVALEGLTVARFQDLLETHMQTITAVREILSANPTDATAGSSTGPGDGGPDPQMIVV